MSMLSFSMPPMRRHQSMPLAPASAAHFRGASSPAEHPRIQSIAPASAISDQFQPKSVRVLLPEGTPVFLLHGTSNNGGHMNPLVHWLRREVQTEHPAYVAYLPEVEKATGILRVENPLTTMPSYLLALRELGTFRYQMVQQRLKTMHQAAINAHSPDEAIARFFKVRPSQAHWLAPLIRHHLLKPLEAVPGGWHESYTQPLQALVNTANAKIRTEVDKLHLRPDERNRAFYDSEFLASKARYEGKKANFDPGHPVAGRDTINIRPLTLDDTALLEGYLLSMQTALTAGIRGHWERQGQRHGKAISPADELRAVKTAEKLIDTLAPRVLALGHSQGGTVIRMANMMHTQNRPPAEVDISKSDPRLFPTLPGRSVGMEMPLSSPLGGGIPSIPVWGHKLLVPINAIEQQIPILSRYPGALGRWVEQAIWAHKTKHKPAVEEMRQNSPVVKQIRERIHQVEDTGLTVLNVMASDDAYVEPQASLLKGEDGRYPVNVFNLQIETPQKIPPVYTQPDEIVNDIASAVPVVGSLIARWFPEGWKHGIQKFYEEELIGMEQHRALVTFPQAISREVGRLLTRDPEYQDRAIDSRQFEPFRHQALQVLAGRWRRQLDNQSPREALARLETLLADRATLLPALIHNAQEALPLQESASHTATTILEKIVHIAAVAQKQTPALPLGDNVKAALQQLGAVDIPKTEAEHDAVSARASRLLGA